VKRKSMKKTINNDLPPLDDNLFRIDQKELSGFSLPSKVSAATIIPRDASKKKKTLNSSTPTIIKKG
jgi:hypothetical protein